MKKTIKIKCLLFGHWWSRPLIRHFRAPKNEPSTASNGVPLYHYYCVRCNKQIERWADEKTNKRNLK